jgi:CRP-like cAMP-binding protein
MSIDDEYDLLRQLELFENLDPIQLKRLIFVSQRYQLDPNEYLFREGDDMGNVYGIVKGQFSVILYSSRGDVIVAHLGPGDLIGEMAVISGEPRNASIRAESECEVIEFEKELFINTVINHPPTALKMMQLLSERLEDQNQQLAQLPGAHHID